ncbi:MAG TPA: ectonucleotide pyrophosphatase/phosphodiesterase [Longimicrobiales bacterium]|nr:ectonucleotide pyrophosphatase/phosphodiesterase [Longimicrobiales bacterium]
MGTTTGRSTAPHPHGASYRLRAAGWMHAWLVGAFFLAGCAGRNDAVPSIGSATPPPAGYVVMVSFDGFRYDYLDRGLTPVLDSLARTGVRADGLLPVMPTKTFPNHYAIATGMYSEEHRLTANTFRDPDLGLYTPADRTTVEDGRWYGGEPIWVAARRQGLRTASMFWVGTEADVQGVRPDIWHPFDEDVAPDARVDSVLAWLQLPAAERPRLLTTYFEFTDNAGSWHGPESPEADSAIAHADAVMGRLMRGIRALPHGDSVAVIVVSDHGMADVRGAVFLDEHDVSLDGVHAMFQGPFTTIYADGDTARMELLRAQLEPVPHIRTWYRSDLPREWRWSDPRLGDLIVIAEPGWVIGRTRQVLPPGAHGWSPAMREMQAIFIASGAGVRKGSRIPAFRNVHIHAFVAALLGISPGSGSAGPGPLTDQLERPHAARR